MTAADPVALAVALTFIFGGAAILLLFVVWRVGMWLHERLIVRSPIARRPEPERDGLADHFR